MHCVEITLPPSSSQSLQSSRDCKHLLISFLHTQSSHLPHYLYLFSWLFITQVHTFIRLELLCYNASVSAPEITSCLQRKSLFSTLAVGTRTIFISFSLSPPGIRYVQLSFSPMHPLAHSLTLAASTSTNSVHFTCSFKTFACALVPVDDYLPFSTSLHCESLSCTRSLFVRFFFTLIFTRCRSLSFAPLTTFFLSFSLQTPFVFHYLNLRLLADTCASVWVCAHIQRHADIRSVRISMWYRIRWIVCCRCICVERFISQFLLTWYAFRNSSAFFFHILFGCSDRRLPFQIRWYVTFLSWIATESVRAVYAAC